MEPELVFKPLSNLNSTIFVVLAKSSVLHVSLPCLAKMKATILDLSLWEKLPNDFVHSIFKFNMYYVGLSSSPFAANGDNNACQNCL